MKEKKIVDISLLFGLIMLVLLFVVIGVVANHVFSTDLTKEEIEAVSNMTIWDFIFIGIQIPAWGLAVGTIVNWERIQKVWKSKQMPMLLFGGSVLIGLMSILIKYLVFG